MGATTPDRGNAALVGFPDRVWTVHRLCAAGGRFGGICSRDWGIPGLRSETSANLSMGNVALARRSCSWNAWRLAAQPLEVVCPCLLCGNTRVLVLCCIERVSANRKCGTSGENASSILFFSVVTGHFHPVRDLGRFDECFCPCQVTCNQRGSHGTIIET